MTLTPQPRGTRTPRSQQVVWAALVMALLSVVAATAFLLFESRGIEASLLEDTEFQARVLEDQTSAVVSATDVILRSVGTLMDRGDPTQDTPGPAAMLRASLQGRPYLRSLSLVGPDGRVTASSNPLNEGTRVPDDWVAGGDTSAPSARLRPVSSGRDLNDLDQVPLAQARVLALPMTLATASGGLVVALINPDHLATQFDRMVADRGARALLLTLDGQFVTGSSAVAVAPGTPMGGLPAFSRHLPRIEAASDIGPGSDGEPAFTAFRVTRNWPLVVHVELPRQRWATDLRHMAGWTATFLLVTCATLAGATVAFRRALRRDERLARELLRAHTATRASESRKQGILQSSLDAIVTVDRDGRVIEFNAAAETMFGRSADAALGAPMDQLIVPPRHRSAHQAGMARYRATGVAHVLRKRIEIDAMRADGTEFPVELTIVPVMTERGEVFTATLRDITERRRVEQALRDSEARANATFEQAAVGVVQQGLDRRPVRINGTFCRMLGYTRDELLDLPVEDTVHPDDRELSADGLRRLMAGEIAVFSGDRRYVRKDGTLFWARVTASLARDDDGQPLSIVGIVEDIDDQRRAQEALRESRIILDKVGRIARVGGWSLDLATSTMRWTDQTSVIHDREPGYQPLGLDEAIGYFAPGAADRMSHAIRRSGEEGAGLDLELPLVTATGRQIWVHALGEVERDDGRPARIVGAFQDITEQRHIRQALRASRALLEETGRIAGIGGWELDVASGDMRSTDEACRIHGIPPGTHGPVEAALRFYAPEAQPVIRAAVDRCIRTGDGFDLQLPFVTAQGRRIWVRAVGAAEQADGHTVRLLGALQDITAQVEAQEALRLARSREIAIGARIQQALLVDAPDQRLPGLWLSTLSQASQGIDGDFVELIPLGDRGIDIIVGDVMGKGVAAALMAAGTKMQFSRCVADLLAQPGRGGELPSPAEVMAAVHRTLVPNLQALEAFVTLSYLRLDTRAGTLTWVGCGHEAPLLVKPGGHLQALANQHPPMGVLDDSDYRQDTLPIERGDAIFLCSDGASDALLPGGDRFGRDRVTGLLTGLLGRLQTPAAVLHALRRELDLAGARITDDLTLALAVVTAPAREASRRELAPTIDNLEHVRGLVRARCREAGLDPVETDLFAVACVEAYTNAVRHTRGRLPEAPIELVVRTDAQAVVVDIVTPGEPFEPPATLPETSFGEFPEGGFGLDIIQQASDRVEYLHDLGVNTVRLTRWRPVDAR